jgi:hypothetical protein
MGENSLQPSVRGTILVNTKRSAELSERKSTPDSKRRKLSFLEVGLAWLPQNE